MKNANTKTITTTALMAALVFVGTFFFKIPSPFGGYAHLGDCMIILAVCLLGTYRGYRRSHRCRIIRPFRRICGMGTSYRSHQRRMGASHGTVHVSSAEEIPFWLAGRRYRWWYRTDHPLHTCKNSALRSTGRFR